MLKKITLATVVLFLVSAQAYFIYALQHGGTSVYADLWRSFGVNQTEYSKYVFHTIKWWWSLPGLCLSLLALALVRPTIFRSALAWITSLAGTIALYWSAYAPALFINI